MRWWNKVIAPLWKDDPDEGTGPTRFESSAAYEAAIEAVELGEAEEVDAILMAYSMGYQNALHDAEDRLNRLHPWASGPAHRLARKVVGSFTAEVGATGLRVCMCETGRGCGVHDAD